MKRQVSWGDLFFPKALIKSRSLFRWIFIFPVISIHETNTKAV